MAISALLGDALAGEALMGSMPPAPPSVQNVNLTGYENSVNNDFGSIQPGTETSWSSNISPTVPQAGNITPNVLNDFDQVVGTPVYEKTIKYGNTPSVRHGIAGEDWELLYWQGDPVFQDDLGIQFLFYATSTPQDNPAVLLTASDGHSPLGSPVFSLLVETDGSITLRDKDDIDLYNTVSNLCTGVWYHILVGYDYLASELVFRITNPLINSGDYFRYPVAGWQSISSNTAVSQIIFGAGADEALNTTFVCYTSDHQFSTSGTFTPVQPADQSVTLSGYDSPTNQFGDLSIDRHYAVGAITPSPEFGELRIDREVAVTTVPNEKTVSFPLVVDTGSYPDGLLEVTFTRPPANPWPGDVTVQVTVNGTTGLYDATFLALDPNPTEYVIRAFMPEALFDTGGSPGDNRTFAIDISDPTAEGDLTVTGVLKWGQNVAGVDRTVPNVYSIKDKIGDVTTGLRNFIDAFDNSVNNVIPAPAKIDRSIPLSGFENANTFGVPQPNTTDEPGPFIISESYVGGQDYIGGQPFEEYDVGSITSGSTVYTNFVVYSEYEVDLDIFEEADQYGAVSVDRTVQLSGYEAPNDFGTLLVQSETNVAVDAFDNNSANDFGTLGITLNKEVGLDIYNVPEQFGTVLTGGVVEITLDGYTALNQFRIPRFDSRFTPAGFNSTEVIPQPRIDLALGLAGINSTEQFGTVSVDREVNLEAIVETNQLPIPIIEDLVNQQRSVTGKNGDLDNVLGTIVVNNPEIGHIWTKRTFGVAGGTPLTPLNTNYSTTQNVTASISDVTNFATRVNSNDTTAGYVTWNNINSVADDLYFRMYFRKIASTSEAVVIWNATDDSANTTYTIELTELNELKLRRNGVVYSTYSGVPTTWLRFEIHLDPSANGIEWRLYDRQSYELLHTYSEFGQFTMTDITTIRWGDLGTKPNVGSGLSAEFDGEAIGDTTWLGPNKPTIYLDGYESTNIIGDQITNSREILVSGHENAEQFGTVSNSLVVNVDAYNSPESVYSVTLDAFRSLEISSHNANERFGVVTLGSSTGFSVDGHKSTNAFGSLFITQQIFLTGYTSTNIIPSNIVEAENEITLNGYQSTDKFGTLRFDTTVLPQLFNSTNSFGNVELVFAVFLQGHEEVNEFGTLKFNQRVQLTGFDSVAQFGTQLYIPSEASEDFFIFFVTSY